MNLIPVALQTLAVAVAAFAILALLAGHLRYRKLVLLAEEEAENLLPVPSAVLLLLERLRRETLCLLEIRPSGGADLPALKSAVRNWVRVGDEVWRLEGGALLVALRTGAPNLPAVADRLQSHLARESVTAGRMRLFAPSADPEELLSWLEASDAAAPAEGWTRDPGTWPYPEEAPPPSPLVDPLTGVLRPERVPQALRRLMASHRRRNLPLTLVRVDVDHLAEVNREHGREAGDAVLRRIGELLMAGCRETDLIGRVEEDEFLICCPGPPDRMAGVAARLSDTVRDTAIPVEGTPLRCTVSCGLASAPAHGQNPNALFERAGLALASAKQRGRGSCRVFAPDMRPAREERPWEPETKNDTF